MAWQMMVVRWVLAEPRQVAVPTLVVEAFRLAVVPMVVAVPMVAAVPTLVVEASPPVGVPIPAAVPTPVAVVVVHQLVQCRNWDRTWFPGLL